MIIWIASYPKSGNTWLRLFLESYFSNIKNNFKFGGFPDPEDYKKINLDYTKINELIKNWKILQDIKNLNGKTNLLKTHNALCRIGKYTFTDKTNTLGAIYIVRDPRDIIISYANHLGLKHEEVLKYMLDKNAFGVKKHFGKDIDVDVMGRWSDNYNSWKNYKDRQFIFIKYENLVSNTKEEFLRILKYLNKLTNIEVNIEQMHKSIEETSFEKLKKNEQIYGFDQATGNGPFFRKGIVGDWKNNLDKEIVSKIEEEFESEMKELGYLS